MAVFLSNRIGALITAAALALGVLLLNISALHAGTLKTVQERGKLVCGVSEGLLGFSAQPDGDSWKGFDVDFCRSVAAAVLGDADKVTYVPLSAVERFKALSSGKIDMLSRNTTWTLNRDIEQELEYAGVSYYDGQGFLTHVDNGLSSALQLSGKKLCVLQGTTTIGNAKAFFARAKIDIEMREFAKREDALKAYEKRECDAFTADSSALASLRTRMKTPDDHMLLPEVISKEPLGPVVRQHDAAWIEIVRWTLFLLINAEEIGWSSGNADKMPESSSLVITGAAAKKLGLKASWARDVIAAVGNYGEIFERNLGNSSPLKLERGLNALWTQGGILYAPPMR